MMTKLIPKCGPGHRIRCQLARDCHPFRGLTTGQPYTAHCHNRYGHNWQSFVHFHFHWNVVFSSDLFNLFFLNYNFRAEHVLRLMKQTIEMVSRGVSVSQVCLTAPCTTTK